MTTCALCGRTYRFDSNGPHVCTAGGWRVSPLALSSLVPASAEADTAGPPAEAWLPRYLLESEPTGNHRVWSGFLSADLLGSLCIQYDDLPDDRPAMRRLLHERLQVFGDDLLAEWERVRTEETHAPPKEREA